jgi:thiamine biosynthesis lipoprotein
MGTVFSIDVRTPGLPMPALTDALAFLHRTDATFSTYRADSEISRVNRGELDLRDCSPEVIEVVRLATDLERRTNGYFSCRYNGELDPSGLVKGWAVAQVSAMLGRAGSRNHCVNGGGDVQCLGNPSGSQLWRIGLADPLDRTALLGVITGSQIAVATSGTAERGAHILDPHTSEPARDLVSLSVVGADIMLADAYATAGFAMGAAALGWLETVEGYEALAVAADGTRTATSGMAPDLGQSQE